MLDQRHAKVLKRGRRIRELDAEGLHELRKELKKLRYAVDMLGPIYKESRVDGYLEPLKELQDSFGSLNDAAMAGRGAGRAGRAGAATIPPRSARSAGCSARSRVRGVEDDRPKLFERWDRLATKAPPFWR